MWIQQLFCIPSTLVNSVYSDMVVISRVCNLRLDVKLAFFSNFWESCCYFRACFSICSLWIYLQSLVLPKSPPRKSKMVPYNVCLPAKFLKMCHLLRSAWNNNDNGSSFEAKLHLLVPYCGGCTKPWIQYHGGCLLLMPYVYLLQ